MGLRTVLLERATRAANAGGVIDVDTLRMSAERAIAALLLSPPSVIAFRPIRIGKLPEAKRRQAVPPNFVGVTDIAIFIFLPVFCFV